MSKGYDFWFSSASRVPSVLPLHPAIAFGPLLSAEPIADIFQSSALLSLQSQCHCSCHVVESSFDRALWWITWLRLLEKRPSDPIALLFHRKKNIQFISPALSCLLLLFSFHTQCFKSYSLQTHLFSSHRASQSKYLAGLVHKRSAFTCLRCWRQGTLCYVEGLKKQNFAG